MPVFRFFNIKVLPVSGRRADLIGEDGYRQLFGDFQRSFRGVRGGGRLREVSAPLPNDFYFFPLMLRVEHEAAFGTFIKFDQPNGLIEPLSGELVQSIPRGVSAHRFDFYFVFDYRSHVLAIEAKTRLPSGTSLINALTHLIGPAALRRFPEHFLVVEQLASSSELDRVMREASGFRRAEVDLTLSNADDYIDDEIKDAEKELRDKAIASVRHVEQSAPGGKMSDVSQRCKAFLALARKNGNATLRYFVGQKDKLVTYVMRNKPYKTRVPRRKGMSEPEYVEEILRAISSADKSAQKPDVR